MEYLDGVMISANFGTWFAPPSLRSGAWILALDLSPCALLSKPIRMMAGEMPANWANVLRDSAWTNEILHATGFARLGDQKDWNLGEGKKSIIFLLTTAYHW
jgi:hypothetical protein